MRRSMFRTLACIAVAVSFAATAAERAIDKEEVIAATPAQLWDAWTTRDGIVSFFSPDAEIEPRVGGAFHIFINPLAPPGMKGADDTRFLALQKPSMLSFDWNAPPSLPEIRAQRTFVVVRIAPVDDKRTRVSLHHTGWGDGGEWDKAYVYFDRSSNSFRIFRAASGFVGRASFEVASNVMS